MPSTWTAKIFDIEPGGQVAAGLGRARITSRITRESETLSFGVLELGDQNVSGGVREHRGEEAYKALVSEIKEMFARADVPNLVRAVDRNFGHGTYSLRLLFRDEQRKIVSLIMEKALAEAAALYRSFYAHYATLARFHSELNIPLPSRFQMAVEFTLHEELLEVLSADEPDAERVAALLEQVSGAGIPLDQRDAGVCIPPDGGACRAPVRTRSVRHTAVASTFSASWR